ncbi:MAG: hypothetical protein V1740_06845 [Candidatus Woesearchaeota archaeon]
MAVKKKIAKVEKDPYKNLISLLKDKFDFLIELLKKKMDEIRHEIKKRILIVVFYGLGIFFLIFGTAQVIERIFPGIAGGGGSIIIGLLLLVIGFIYGLGARKR